MHRLKVSHLAAEYAKNEIITGETITYHTVDDITVITVYDKDMNIIRDFMFRDVFRIEREHRN